MTRVAAAVVLGLVLVVGVAPAQTPEPQVAEALRVQWERVTERPAIEGYVYNDSDYRIGLVRLRVAAREAAGQPPTETLAWVYGNVPAHGRWYFRVRVPRQHEVLGVTIESFRLIAREPTPESP
ncbi:MAG TPA: FxLYD domain-containing protein [Methylomirabilota bacterium]|nr:FxLYD domain-containing protein [Methylomirabilota bacterium]